MLFHLRFAIAKQTILFSEMLCTYYVLIFTCRSSVLSLEEAGTRMSRSYRDDRLAVSDGVKKELDRRPSSQTHASGSLSLT